MKLKPRNAKPSKMLLFTQAVRNHMKNAILPSTLMLLLLASFASAGFFEDITSAIGNMVSGVTQAISDAVFGVPTPDAESVCIEYSIENYKGYLSREGEITEQVAWKAYDEFQNCKTSPNVVANYWPVCLKKTELVGFCSELRRKCDNSKISDERFTTAKAAGGCFIAENMCSNAINKNYAACRRGTVVQRDDDPYLYMDKITLTFYKDKSLNTYDGSSASSPGNSFLTIDSSLKQPFEPRLTPGTSSKKLFLVTQSDRVNVPVGSLYLLTGSTLSKVSSSNSYEIDYRYYRDINRPDLFKLELKQNQKLNPNGGSTPSEDSSYVTLTSRRLSPFEFEGSFVNTNSIYIDTSSTSSGTVYAAAGSKLVASPSTFTYNFRGIDGINVYDPIYRT